MSNGLAIGQDANILPPKGGAILAETLDTTSRVIDLGLVALGGDPVVEKGGVFFVTLRANVAFYFRFDAAPGGTVDETAADAAGATPTFQANACWDAYPGEEKNYRISRIGSRYLVVKGSAAGKLRIYVSSEVSDRRG